MRPDAHTLVAAYAVDALDGAESADVSEHLAQCETCRDDLRGFRETVAVLAAVSAEAPPARMRAAVLARARSTPQLPPLTGDEPGTAAPPAAAGQASTAPGPAGGGLAGTPSPAGAAAGGDVPAGALSSLPASRRADGTAGSGSGGGTVRGTASRRGGPSRALFGLAASVVTAVAVGAGAFAVVQSDRLEEVQEQQAAVQRVLSAEDVVTLSGVPTLAEGVQGDEVVVLASASRDAALLLPAGLPEAPEGSTWQAWAVTGDRAVSAGTFDTASGEAVALQASVAGADAVAVSLEPAGGSESPSSDPVLVLPLT